VTAFASQSYKQLTENSGDISVRLLTQISAQLNNPNAPAAVLPELDKFNPSSSSIRVNVFFFLSLIASLSSALLGILCKQWLREYQREVGVSQREAFELRQLRYQSWETWGVPKILSSIPLLLELALLLFFAGVVDLLWSLNHVVALFVAAAAGLGISVLGLTTVLPSFYVLFCIALQPTKIDLVSPSAYKSTQSWICLQTIQPMLAIYRSLFPGSIFADIPLQSSPDWSAMELNILRLSYYSGKPELVSEFPIYLKRGMKWVGTVLGDNIPLGKHVFHCIQSCTSGRFRRLVVREPMNEPKLALTHEELYSYLKPFRADDEMFCFQLELLLRAIDDGFAQRHVPHSALEDLMLW
jgi:hypothetical protein